MQTRPGFSTTFWKIKRAAPRAPGFVDIQTITKRRSGANTIAPTPSLVAAVAMARTDVEKMRAAMAVAKFQRATGRKVSTLTAPDFGTDVDRRRAAEAVAREER